MEILPVSIRNLSVQLELFLLSLDLSPDCDESRMLADVMLLELELGGYYPSQLFCPEMGA